jgi:hypothetical protein
VSDEFDSLLESEEEPEPKREYSRTPLPNNVIKDMVVRPDVARLIIEGVPPADIAAQMGIKEGTLRKYLKRAPMQELLDIEATRIMRHLAKRDLSKEKYLSIATAAAMFIDKSRGIRDGVQDNATVINQTFIQNIDVALFGPGGRKSGESESQRPTELGPDAVRSLPEDPEPKTGK